MTDNNSDYETYFRHLQSITLPGRLYKRWITSPVLFSLARSFGPRILEVGCGIGAGVLGAYPGHVTGVDINPRAVESCLSRGLDARLIGEDDTWDMETGSFDACILDNVLEHVADPSLLLRECSRVTSPQAGLIVAVPGLKGFASDADHKMCYDEQSLRNVDHGWSCTRVTGMPMWIGHRTLSRRLRQFCYVAVYRKAAAVKNDMRAGA